MKLSTKLLIGLAITMFVVPTLIASYLVRITRIDTNVYHANIEKEVTRADAKDIYFKSFPTAQFDKLHILGANANGLNVYLVKSERFLIKVSKDQADYVRTKVNADGYLTVEFLAGSDQYYKPIYIFSPDLKVLKLKKASVNEFSAQLDELTIEGDSIEAFSLDGKSAINTLNLKLTNSIIDHFGSPDRDASAATLPVNHLFVDVTNTSLGLPGLSYQSASILARNSEVYFSKRTPVAKVNTLNIKTEGMTSVRLDSLQWGTLQGNLSNDTKIDLPVHALRTLIK